MEAAVQQTMSDRALKRSVMDRLKAYRARHGPGCLAKVAAHCPRHITDDFLLSVSIENAPKMRMNVWTVISNALDKAMEEVTHG